MPLSEAVPDASSRCCPGVCVAAVLGDALRRVAVLGGREGMPRSLGSVYGGAVTRFLGGGCRGVVSRVIATAGVVSWSNGVALSRDGSTLLVSDYSGGSDAIHAFRVADGSRLAVLTPSTRSVSLTARGCGSSAVLATGRCSLSGHARCG